MRAREEVEAEGRASLPAEEVREEMEAEGRAPLPAVPAREQMEALGWALLPVVPTRWAVGRATEVSVGPRNSSLTVGGEAERTEAEGGVHTLGLVPRRPDGASSLLVVRLPGAAQHSVLRRASGQALLLPPRQHPQRPPLRMSRRSSERNRTN